MERWISCLSEWLGRLVSLFLLFLIALVMFNVTARYGFNYVVIGLQELEWHLFSAIFLLGASYAIKTGSHVRVDVFYENFSERTQGYIDIFGTVFFLIPFCGLVAWYSVDFVKESYDLGEVSINPGGLSHRWLIKAVIPLSFGLMAISSLELLLRSIRKIQGRAS